MSNSISNLNTARLFDKKSTNSTRSSTPTKGNNANTNTNISLFDKNHFSTFTDYTNNAKTNKKKEPNTTSNANIITSNAKEKIDNEENFFTIYGKLTPTDAQKKEALNTVYKFLDDISKKDNVDKNKLFSLMAKFKYGRSGYCKSKYSDKKQNAILNKINKFIVTANHENPANQNDGTMRAILTIMRNQNRLFKSGMPKAMRLLFKAYGFSADRFSINSLKKDNKNLNEARLIVPKDLEEINKDNEVDAYKDNEVDAYKDNEVDASKNAIKTFLQDNTWDLSNTGLSKLSKYENVKLYKKIQQQQQIGTFLNTYICSNLKDYNTLMKKLNKLIRDMSFDELQVAYELVTEFNNFSISNLNNSGTINQIKKIAEKIPLLYRENNTLIENIDVDNLVKTLRMILNEENEKICKALNNDNSVTNTDNIKEGTTFYKLGFKNGEITVMSPIIEILLKIITPLPNRDSNASANNAKRETKQSCIAHTIDDYYKLITNKNTLKNIFVANNEISKFFKTYNEQISFNIKNNMNYATDPENAIKFLK